MVKAIEIYYENSQSGVVQGNKTVKRFKNDGYYIQQGGFGTYRMNKSSTVILEFEVDGQVIRQSIKELIREKYHISRVGKKQADSFFKEVKEGKIKLEYSNGKLIIA